MDIALIKDITRLCKGYGYHQSQLSDITEIYVQLKNLEKGEQTNLQNKELIRQRKKEYHKRERANKELLVNTYGCFLGLTSKALITYLTGNEAQGAVAVKILERVGIRVNFSVFECMLTERQYEILRDELLQVISLKEDTVVYYPICLNCYSQIVYQPRKRETYPVVRIV